MVDRVLPSWMTCVGCAELKERCAAKDAEIAALRERVEVDRIALWNAINEYVKSCSGDPSKRVYGNAHRMNAVAEIERILRGEGE